MLCTVDEEFLPFVTTHPSARPSWIKVVYIRCSHPPSLAREGFHLSNFARELYFQHPDKSKFEILNEKEQKMKSNKTLAITLIVLLVVLVLLTSLFIKNMFKAPNATEQSTSTTTTSTTKSTTASTTTTTMPTTKPTTTTTTQSTQKPNPPEDEYGVYGYYLYDIDPDNNGYRILGIDPDYLAYQSPPDILEIPRKINGIQVTAIGANAFEGMPSTKIILPEGLIDIYKNAFYNSRVEEINIPSTVIYIGSAAFQKCHFLKSIEIPNGVNTIRDNTFRECTYLESVILPDTLIYIGNYAFAQLQTLTSIIVPIDCEIEDTAFNYSPNLEVEYK